VSSQVLERPVADGFEHAGVRSASSVRTPVVLKWAEWTAVAVLLAVPLFGSVSHARFTLDPSHTGYFLKLALDVTEGKVLFRDAFDPYGALTVWIQAIGLRLFKNVQTLIWTTGMMLAATGLLLYAIWRRLLPPAGALGALLIFVAHTRWPTIPWPNYYGTFFITAAAWFLVRHLETPARWRLTAAGAMAGLAFLSRHEIGLFGFGAVAVYLLFRAERGSRLAAGAAPGRRELALVACGFAAVVAIFLVWLLAVGALTDWYLQAVRMIPAYYEPLVAVETRFVPRVFQLLDILFAKYQFLLLFTLGFATALFIVGVTRGFEAREERIAFLLAVLALSGAMQSYPIPNEFRYALGLSPAYALLIYAMRRPAASERRAPTIIAVAVALFATQAELRALTRDIVTQWNVRRAHYPGYRRLNQPAILKGVWLPDAQARFYAEISGTISRYVRQRPGTPVLTTTGDPLPLTFVDRNPNFHQMFVVYPSVGFAQARGMFNRPHPQPLPDEFKDYGRFAGDTANVLLYPDFWDVYRRFVASRKPLVINHGAPVPSAGYQALLDITYPEDVMVDSRFNYWWDQFGPTPRLVIWGYAGSGVSQ
jgi:hypothetical protein